MRWLKNEMSLANAACFFSGCLLYSVLINYTVKLLPYHQLFVVTIVRNRSEIENVEKLSIAVKDFSAFLIVIFEKNDGKNSDFDTTLFPCANIACIYLWIETNATFEVVLQSTLNTIGRLSRVNAISTVVFARNLSDLKVLLHCLKAMRFGVQGFTIVDTEDILIFKWYSKMKLSDLEKVFQIL